MKKILMIIFTALSFSKYSISIFNKNVVKKIPNKNVRHKRKDHNFND